MHAQAMLAAQTQSETAARRCARHQPKDSSQAGNSRCAPQSTHAGQALEVVHWQRQGRTAHPKAEDVALGAEMAGPNGLGRQPAGVVGADGPCGLVGAVYERQVEVGDLHPPVLVHHQVGALRTAARSGCPFAGPRLRPSELGPSPVGHQLACARCQQSGQLSSAAHRAPAAGQLLQHMVLAAWGPGMGCQDTLGPLPAECCGVLSALAGLLITQAGTGDARGRLSCSANKLHMHKLALLEGLKPGLQ